MPKPEIPALLYKHLPAECVLSDAEDLRPYECDGLSAYHELPLAVVIPETLEQIQTTLLPHALRVHSLRLFLHGRRLGLSAAKKQRKSA